MHVLVCFRSKQSVDLQTNSPFFIYDNRIMFFFLLSCRMKRIVPFKYSLIKVTLFFGRSIHGTPQGLLEQNGTLSLWYTPSIPMHTSLILFQFVFNFWNKWMHCLYRSLWHNASIIPFTVTISRFGGAITLKID